MNSDIYSILGNEIRMKILLSLSQGEKNVSELILQTSLAQSAVSQHLQKLRAYDMVQVRCEGREKYYSIADRDLITISILIQQYVDKKNRGISSSIA